LSLPVGMKTVSATVRPSRTRRVVRVLLGTFWYAIAVALLAWAATYLGLRAAREPTSLVVYAVPFLVTFFVMFYGEGTEIAITSLKDKDPEQIPDALRPGFEAFQASSHVLFISGRQLLVVLSIVALTLLCDNVSDIGPLVAGMPSFAKLLALPQVHTSFTLFFPTFFALWFAQLPPKFIAHESPLSAYSWQFTRLIIASSLFLGRTLRVDGPSTHLKELLVRLLPLSKAVLKPSREFYYETSATLRDGKALEQLYTALEIAHDGSISAKQHFRFRAYANGFRRISQRIGWESPINQAGAAVQVSCPVPHSLTGPSYAPWTNRDGLALHSLDWRVDLPGYLPVGAQLDVDVVYSTQAGAMRSTIGDVDYFRYTVSKVPTAEIVFEVQPEVNAGFVLIEGNASADTSDDQQVNKAEESRIAVEPLNGGYRYTVKYPLPSTVYQFNWTLAPGTVPLPPPPPH